MNFLRFFTVVIFVCTVAGCNLSNYDGDDRNSIPKTDNSSFVSTTKIIFPKDTDALHIYNCLFEKYGEGTHSVTAVYSRTVTATLNGTAYSNTITKNIVQIKISKEISPPTSKFIVDFITDTNEVLRFFYEWQYHNTNEWNNNKTDGSITITL
ncbi:hypothetical protein HRO26_00005 [Treponema pectinovorum]|uniref:hypothetical protein n=1 Tax=Treponema pectinovorum TaxID=164 RepID=UPI003D923EF2